MESLLEPEIRGTYNKCKLKVKYWEHQFKKKYGRLPSKFDIREADREIRYAYKTYFNLKSAALEQSFQDIDGFNSDGETTNDSTIASVNNFNDSQQLESNVLTSESNAKGSEFNNFKELGANTNVSALIEGKHALETSCNASDDATEADSKAWKAYSKSLQTNFNAEAKSVDIAASCKPSEDNSKAIGANSSKVSKVWGEHLNNSYIATKNKKKEDSNLDVNSSFSQKLFKNSTFSKRNPRKSLSFHHRKSDNNLNSSRTSLSQPVASVSTNNSDNDSFSTSSQDNLRTISYDNLLTANLSNSFEDSNASLNVLNSDRISIASAAEDIQTKSLNIIQSMLDNTYQCNRKLNAGWMERVAGTTGTKLVNKNLNDSNFSLSSQINSQNNDEYDSDDIIIDSDEEDAKLHFNKRRKLEVNQSILCEKKSVGGSFNSANVLRTSSINNLNDSAIEEKGLVESVIQAKPLVAIHEKALVKDASQEKMVINDAIDEKMCVEDEIAEKNLIENGNSKVKNVAKKVRRVPDKRNRKQITSKVQKVENDVEKIVPRKSTRVHKALVDLQEEFEDNDPFENDEENDPEFVPGENKQNSKFNFDSEEIEEEEAQIEKKSARKSKGKKEKPNEVDRKSTRKSKKEKEKQENPNNEDETEENATYELEYSIKQRVVTVPRHNIKNIVAKSAKQVEKVVVPKEQNVVKDKKQQQYEKLEQKIASGNLNENFVQINLKKKIYARGKKTMNFSKYKKKMWKQHKKNNALAGPEMDMGGCDGGQLTCFNCGGVGHFAQKCPKNKGDTLLPLAAVDEEYCPFPTLEEASQMAHDSNLMIRKPKNIAEKAENAMDVDSQEVTKGDSSSSEEEKEDPFAGEEDDDEFLLAETLKLEEYVRNIEVQQYTDEKRSIKPYYKLNEDGSIVETPEEVFEALRLFGHTSFRPGQESAVMRILSGQSTLVTLSTGSGKSLCYQLPAYLYAKREPCIALIISPLVSLMEDQVTGIPSFLKAACLHTNKTKTQREKILEAIGAGSLDVLLVSPEAVVAGEKQTGFGSLLRKLPPVAFACIDEAHCVSQWSHNFRPSYLMICRILQERLGVHTILGLTATATRATCDSIVNHLQIPDGINGIISDIPLPENLHLTVSKDGNRDHALLGLLLSERFENLRSIIVYCTRRQECERIASYLRTSLKSERPTEVNSKKRKKLNVQAEPYHAGLSASRRRTIQKNFMSGVLRIVVATVAFGMGINKSDIRAVIHYNLPKNFESYVQEVGRAGRDGIPAHCHLFLDSQGRDENELQRHVFSDSIDRHVIRKLLKKIFIPCSCKATCPKHEVAFSIQETVMALDIPEENIATLLCYLELHEERYIEVLSPAYVTCKIIAYGSGNHIRQAAKDCPPLAMALVMYGNKERDENMFEFPVVEVAASMGWDSGICKHKLKNLEWVTENNQPKRSLLSVQFINLGFRLLAPGNLSDSQLDEALDSLHNRVKDQERTALLQLHALHHTVTSVAAQSFRACISDEVSEKELKLKACIREYFDSPKPLSMIDLKAKKVDEGLIANDVRAIINMYRDNSFTGRAIARIFYGIPSPNYPAVIWGRCKFWRLHINSDFNAICRIATQEILKMR